MLFPLLALLTLLCPQAIFAGYPLVITATIEQQESNRVLRVVVDCDRFYSSSDTPIDQVSVSPSTPSRSHLHYRFEFPRLPAGECHVTTSVLGVSGKVRASSVKHVMVIPT